MEQEQKSQSNGKKLMKISHKTRYVPRSMFKFHKNEVDQKFEKHITKTKIIDGVVYKLHATKGWRIKNGDKS